MFLFVKVTKKHEGLPITKRCLQNMVISQTGMRKTLLKNHCGRIGISFLMEFDLMATKLVWTAAKIVKEVALLNI